MAGSVAFDGRIWTPMSWSAVLLEDVSVTSEPPVSDRQTPGLTHYINAETAPCCLRRLVWMDICVNFFYCKLSPLNNTRLAAKRAEQGMFLSFSKTGESQAFCLLGDITKLKTSHNRLNLLPWDGKAHLPPSPSLTQDILSCLGIK